MEAADARMRAVKGAPAVKGGGKGGKAPAETGKVEGGRVREGTGEMKREWGRRRDRGKDKGRKRLQHLPQLQHLQHLVEQGLDSPCGRRWQLSAWSRECAASPLDRRMILGQGHP